MRAFGVRGAACSTPSCAMSWHIGTEAIVLSIGKRLV